MAPGFNDKNLQSPNLKAKKNNRKKMCNSFMTKSTGHFKNIVKVNKLYEKIM
jgi:hypothetical protein